MDKHDRPYKCSADGCEKLPGFTYSGGLLRHEREVHGKHGGPKNPLHCPHLNCKRHSGKGFSRLENLNEHLRRVHTNNANGAMSVTAGAGGEDTDDGGSETAGLTGVAASMGPGATDGNLAPGTASALAAAIAAGVGTKRKRTDDGGDDGDLRDEIKRVRQENEELRRQVEAQNRQVISMVQQIAQLQESMRAPLAAAPAEMM